MKKWEHYVLLVREPMSRSSDSEFLNKKLKEFEEEGWELVSVVNREWEFWCFFKRPLEIESRRGC